MKTVFLPADVESLYLDEVAELIAYARYPGDDDRSKELYGWALKEIFAEVRKAANDGSLKVTHPITGMILPPVPTDPLDAFFEVRTSPDPTQGLVVIDELCRYVALRGIAVKIETPAPTTEDAHQSRDLATGAESPNDELHSDEVNSPEDEPSVAIRDERALQEREKWIGSGRKAKDWDEKHGIKIGASIYEVRRRMGEARKRRGAKLPKTTKKSAGMWGQLGMKRSSS